MKWIICVCDKTNNICVYYKFYMQVQLWKNVNKKGAEFVLKKHVLFFLLHIIYFYFLLQKCKGQKHIHL